DSGGGIWAGGEEAAFTIEDSTIADNQAITAGGGLNGEFGGQNTISRATISGNISGGEGGGAIGSVDQRASNPPTRSPIAENVADGGGGGIEINPGNEAPPAIIEGSTIVGNHAGSLLGEAGGLQTFGSDPHRLIDSIVADNTGGFTDIYGPWEAAFSLIG